jgi:serine/threonine protein kinase
MSYCINPHCALPDHPGNDQQALCASCGSPLVLQGRYRVDRVISDKGGFGVVYQAHTSKEEKILKVLKHEHNKNHKAVELFAQEAEVLSKLRHPGIPKIDGYFTHEVAGGLVLHCLVMEKIPGNNLEEWQHRQRYKPLEQAQALEWLKFLVEVLGVIHKKSYLHRDIKPSNIMLTPEGRLVLIDFGTARDVTATYLENISRGRSMTSVVSSGYTAPEQSNGKAVEQSDFFALARTFVQLLTGKHPLDMYVPDRDSLDWRAYAPNVTPALADLLDQMMNRKPADRPLNAESLIKQLQTIEKVVKRPDPNLKLESPVKLPSIAIPWQGLSFVLGIGATLLGWYLGSGVGALVGGAIGLVCVTGVSRLTTLSLSPKLSILAHAKTTTALAVTPDGQFFMSAGGDRTIKVWHRKNGQLCHTLVGHGDWVYCLAPAPGGQTLFSGSGDKTIKVWQSQSGLPLETIKGHELGVNCLAVAADESYLVSGSADRTIKVWDLRNYKLVRTINNLGHGVNALLLTPDRQIISGDRSIRVWEIGKNIPVKTLAGHQEEIRALALTPDGKALFSASADRTVKHWNIATGQLVRTLVGHKGEIKALAVHPTKPLLITGSTDRRVGVWHIPSGKLLLALKGHSAEVTCLAICPEGKFLYSGSGDGSVKVWRF